MALVASGVEVSPVAERMEGSERPTHQPAAAPAHTHANTHSRKYSPVALGERLQVGNWDEFGELSFHPDDQVDRNRDDNTELGRGV